MPGWSAAAIRGVMVKYPDIEVEESARPDPERLAEFRPEVVLVPAEEAGVSRPYSELLNLGYPLRVMPVDVVRRGANVYELRLLGRNIGSRDLVTLIRSLVGRTGSQPAEPQAGTGPSPR
jgi:hypothetical protein